MLLRNSNSNSMSMNTSTDVLIDRKGTIEMETRRNRKLLADKYPPKKGYF